GQRSTRRDLEDAALIVASAGVRRAVKVSVAPQDQRAVGSRTVRAARLRAEAIQRGTCAVRGDLVDRAQVVRASAGSRAVAVAVAALRQSGVRRRAVRAAALCAEVVQRSADAGGRYLEHGPTVGAAAEVSRAIEIPVAALPQRPVERFAAVAATR